MKILIKNGRLIDPASKTDERLDILIENTKVSKIEKTINAKDAKVIDAKGMIVAPGLIDMHTHIREPGREDEETIESASKAACFGGFTSISAMPNTEPVCDNSGIVEYIISEAKRNAVINVFPVGAITSGQKGENLADIADMKKAGIMAITDDGHPVRNAQLLRRAMEYSNMFDILVISHCEDEELSEDGQMNEGPVSTILGLRGIPNTSESTIVARDIYLSGLTGARLHIAHVSTEESVELIKQAKKKNLKVTAETCPHYFTLTDEALKGFDTNTKMNPPLRAEKDRQAIIDGLKDSTIDAISTDHAPHTEAEKEVVFDKAPFGIIGLQTALSLAITELVEKRILTWLQLIEKMSLNPAMILGLKGKGRLAQGEDADIVIIDPKEEWIFKIEDILSKSKNSPFIGRQLKGRAICTICSKTRDSDHLKVGTAPTFSMGKRSKKWALSLLF